MGIFSSFLRLLGCHVFRVFKSCLNTYREVLISFSPDPFRSSLVHLYSSDTFPIIPSSSQFLRYRNSYFQFEFKMMCEQYIEGFADLTRWTFCFANIQLGSFFIVSERVRGRVPVKVWEPLREVLRRECLNINIHDHWKHLIKHKWFTVIWVISRQKCIKSLPGSALLMWEMAVFFVLHDHKIKSIYQKKHKVRHADTFKHNKALECEFWN